MDILQKIRQEIECINAGDLDGVCNFYTNDVFFLDVSDRFNPAIGMDSFRESMKIFFEGFSDLKIEITRLFSDGDGSTAIAEYILSGTHDGEFCELKPTYKKFEIMAASVYEFNGQKFTKEILYLDSNSMLKQLSF